jgi:virginiamycin B lyase
MWFTEQAGLVGRVTPGGLITQLALPSPGSNPDGITAGPGRTIWIAETGVDAIARIVLQPAASAG